MVAREKGEIWTLCLPNTGLQQGTYSKSLNPLNAKLNPICHLLALLGAHRILHFSRVGVNPMRIVHIQTQSYSTNTTNYVQDNWKCCGASAQNASTNGRQSRGGHVRCHVYSIFRSQIVTLPRCSWFCSHPSGLYDHACECMVLKWRPTALHSSLRDSACSATSRRGQKWTKSQRKCKRGVKRSSCFIARTQCTAQIYYVLHWCGRPLIWMRTQHL